MLALCSWSLKELKSGMNVLSSRGIFRYVYKLLWLVNIYFTKVTHKWGAEIFKICRGK